MTKRIAILQSNYIPWKGYFDLIASVDEFIIYDEMQFTRRDWRNRNKIKTSDGLQWLTIPVKVKGKYEQTIRETEIDGSAWATLHLKSLQHAYKKAPYFDEVMQLLEPLYAQPSAHLSQLNRTFLETICRYLGINTTMTDASDYALIDGKSERLADLVQQAGGHVYISGPAAKDYLEVAVFRQRGIALEWFDYGGYPEYSQLWGPFEHFVSIVDLLYNYGKNAPDFMKYVR